MGVPPGSNESFTSSWQALGIEDKRLAARHFARSRAPMQRQECYDLWSSFFADVPDADFVALAHGLDAGASSAIPASSAAPAEHVPSALAGLSAGGDSNAGQEVSEERRRPGAVSGLREML